MIKVRDASAAMDLNAVWPGAFVAGAFFFVFRINAARRP